MPFLHAIIVVTYFKQKHKCMTIIVALIFRILVKIILKLVTNSISASLEIKIGWACSVAVNTLPLVSTLNFGLFLPQSFTFFIPFLLFFPSLLCPTLCHGQLQSYRLVSISYLHHPSDLFTPKRDCVAAERSLSQSSWGLTLSPSATTNNIMMG